VGVDRFWVVAPGLGGGVERRRGLIALFRRTSSAVIGCGPRGDLTTLLQKAGRCAGPVFPASDQWHARGARQRRWSLLPRGALIPPSSMTAEP